MAVFNIKFNHRTASRVESSRALDYIMVEDFSKEYEPFIIPATSGAFKMKIPDLLRNS